MIYLLIYLTVGYLWGLYMLKYSIKRYRLITQDQKRTRKEKFKDYLIISTVIMIQSILFWHIQMYYTWKRGGKLHG